jgi:hypothetical protein
MTEVDPFRRRSNSTPSRTAWAGLCIAVTRGFAIHSGSMNKCAKPEDTIPRYEPHIDRSLYEALRELQRLRAARRGDAVPAPVVVDVEVTGVSGGEQ